MRGLALSAQNLPETLQCFGMAGWKLWVPVELIQHFGKRLLLLGVGAPAVADSILFLLSQYPELLRIHVDSWSKWTAPQIRGLGHPLGSPQCLGAKPRTQLAWPAGFFGCHGELGEQHSHQQACRQERHELIFSLPTQRVQREPGRGGKAGRKN